MNRESERGQMLVLLALAFAALLAVVAVVIDGGYAFAQRRGSQNASDFGAIAGARLIAAGETNAATIQAAVSSVVQANGANLVLLQYIKADGTINGSGNGSPVQANGAVVTSQRTWNAFIGGRTLTATTTATARGGGTTLGGVFPFGIALASFNPAVVGHFNICPADQKPVSRGGTCPDQALTDGTSNIPGGFGWLKFGASNKCVGYGLGMSTTQGCPNGSPSGFLQSEIDGNSYGCCTAVSGGSPPTDRIGSLTGHNGNGGDDCTAVIASEATFAVPVWDDAGSQGSHGWYHIVGFVGFQVTQCNGANSAQGVWRLPMQPSPALALAQATPTSVKLLH